MNPAEILVEAQARADARVESYRPPDYAAANVAFRKQKARLTRAVNSGNPDAVVAACHAAVREWGEPPFNGAWPDDWARWQRALDDALGWPNTVRLEDL